MYEQVQVSPTEIELLLNAHAGIEESGVAGMAHARKGEVPVAFVKKKSGVELTEADVKVGFMHMRRTQQVKNIGACLQATQCREALSRSAFCRRHSQTSSWLMEN